MRRARFRTSAGRVLTGEWTDTEVRTVGRSFAHEDVEFLPPVTTGKVIGVTPNHDSQFEGDDPPELDIFLKPASTAVGHDRVISLPLDDEVVYEAELGVVIGRHCSSVDTERAEAVIEGYTCVNDLTRLGERTLNRQKVFDNATPMGPVVAPPRAVPADATIEMHVNGQREQRFARNDYVRTVEEVVGEVSSLISLEPGDLITMGTATGVGRLAEGDVTAVTIEGVGTLRTEVSRAAPTAR